MSDRIQLLLSSETLITTLIAGIVLIILSSLGVKLRIIETVQPNPRSMATMGFILIVFAVLGIIAGGNLSFEASTAPSSPFVTILLLALVGLGVIFYFIIKSQHHSGSSGKDHIEDGQPEIYETEPHQKIKGIERLIQANNRALQKLKEQQATFGTLHTPPHILLEIENRETEIKNLQVKLKEIEANEKPSTH